MTRRSVGVALALSWSDLCCVAAPEAAASRRREEYRSHLADASAAGVSGSRIVLEALAGVVDDVRWCDEVRRAAGRCPLLLTVVEERDAAMVAITGIMVVLYLTTLHPALQPLTQPLLAISLAVLLVAALRPFVQRLRRSREVG